MKNELTLIVICFFLSLSACVEDVSTVEYDQTLQTLKGKWEQAGTNKQKTYYMEFSDRTMKLFRYDENDKLVYLVNGSYSVVGDSIFAKDLSANTYRGYHYELPTCTLMFLDDFKLGFRKTN